MAVVWMDNFSTVVKCRLGNLWVYASDNISSIETSTIYRKYLQTGKYLSLNSNDYLLIF